MTEKVLVFLDDAELLPELSESPGVLVVSLDRDAASQVSRRPGLRVRDIAEYSERHFATYDELYEDLKGAIRERVAPKDAMEDGRLLFEALWDDILLQLAPIHYTEALIRAVLARETPARVLFAIADPRLDALFRRLVQHLS
jgi:hypothetical protein